MRKEGGASKGSELVVRMLRKLRGPWTQWAVPQEEGEELAKDLTLWCRSLDTVGGGPCCCGHDPAEKELWERCLFWFSFRGIQSIRETWPQEQETD